MVKNGRGTAPPRTEADVVTTSVCNLSLEAYRRKTDFMGTPPTEGRADAFSDVGMAPYAVLKAAASSLPLFSSMRRAA